MRALWTFRSSFRTDLSRYLRSPGLILVALAVPIAAHYMVPDHDASYAVLTINNQKPILTAPVLGLELGVLAATLLTPLAYIFLRAGPTRRRPWQITDVAPHSRIVATLGRWMADTAVLWLLLAVLTIAGLILGLFRLDEKANIAQTVIGLWLPAAPSLALISALRLLLDARNLTRRWVGDVIFFFAWIGLMITGIMMTETQDGLVMNSQSMVDAFGYTAPIIGSVDFPVSSVSIGGSTNIKDSVMIDAWGGLTSPQYLKARLFWLGVSAIVAAFAGLIWAPIKARKPKAGRRAIQASGLERLPISQIPFYPPKRVAAGGLNYGAIVLSELKLILKNKIWLVGLVISIALGFLMPFRTVAAPAILLALIFPLTEASSRWQDKSVGSLLTACGPTGAQRTAALYAASVLLVALVIAPAIIRLALHGDWGWTLHIALITFAVPAFIIACGKLTGSAVMGRLLMLIIWYVYLSSASV